MSAAPAELYVYYKLHERQAEAARAAFALARGMAPVRLLQRQEAGQPLLTWMEIYGPSLADAATLEAHIAAVMAPFAQGPRHREVFTPVA